MVAEARGSTVGIRRAPCPHVSSDSIGRCRWRSPVDVASRGRSYAVWPNCASFGGPERAPHCAGGGDYCMLMPTDAWRGKSLQSVLRERGARWGACVWSKGRCDCLSRRRSPHRLMDAHPWRRAGGIPAAGAECAATGAARCLATALGAGAAAAAAVNASVRCASLGEVRPQPVVSMRLRTLVVWRRDDAKERCHVPVAAQVDQAL